MNLIIQTAEQVDANKLNIRLSGVKSVIQVMDMYFTCAQLYTAHGKQVHMHIPAISLFKFLTYFV